MILSKHWIMGSNCRPCSYVVATYANVAAHTKFCCWLVQRSGTRWARTCTIQTSTSLELWSLAEDESLLAVFRALDVLCDNAPRELTWTFLVDQQTQD